MSDPFTQSPNTGVLAVPIWQHSEAPAGYPPSREPILGALTRWGTGVTWAHRERVHPVPCFTTGRFRRIASPPASPGHIVGEGYVMSYAG
jgi:hypothetical protein